MSVLVLGMHRSGTSAVTRAVSLLGIPTCRPEDLLRGHAGNERGHWECAPLVTQNEQLLEAVASRWWCPPESSAQVAELAEDPVRLAAARSAFSTSHPTESWVWKDPRTSLLMPFWRRAIPVQPVVLLVCRDPAEIAASMLARDRISPRFARALWDRHLRVALEGCRGLPQLMVDFADLVTDPLSWCVRTGSFLNAHGIDARVPADPAGLRAFVQAGLRHRPATVNAFADRSKTEQAELDEQAELWDWLKARAHAEPSQEPDLEPPRGGDSVITLMREVREAFALAEPVARPAGGSFVSSAGIRVLQGGATKTASRKARVSVLFLPRGGPASLPEARRLRPRLPAEAEIITVSSPSDRPADEHKPDDRRAAEGKPAECRPDERRGGEGPGSPDWFVVARRDHRMTLAQRLNTAAEIARGDVLVILAGPRATPLPGWLPALRPLLEQPDTAVVGPALRSTDGGDPVFGLAPTSGFLSAKWVTQAPHRQPFRVPATSIAAMVTTRRAFEGVGGFDEGMTNGGGEDVDYCLRLWRAGWRCLAVPAASVELEFETLPASEEDVLANTLRLGLVHLEADQLSEQLRQLATHELFASALGRVSAGDVGRRRLIVDALSWYQTAQLPASLGVQLVSAGEG